jgi:hypothetical protein
MHEVQAPDGMTTFWFVGGTCCKLEDRTVEGKGVGTYEFSFTAESERVETNG